MAQRKLQMKTSSTAQTTGSTSSKGMEQSIPFTVVVALGQKIVAELNLEPGVDTLARWMAHHLAEVLLRAENAKGEDKEKAEQECRALILKIWAHRTALPGRPLESFLPILQTLYRLSGTNPRWYLPQDFEAKGEVGVWLKYALKIDSLLASLMQHCVTQAVVMASAKEKKWLKDNAVALLGRNNDDSLIFYLVETAKDLHDPNARKKAEIKALLQKLDEFEGVAKVIRKRLAS